MAKRQTQASKSNEEIRPKASGLGGLSPGAWSAIVAAIGLVGTLITLAIPRLIPNPPPGDSTTAAKTVVAVQTRANPGASALTFQIEGPDKLVLGQRSDFYIVTSGNIEYLTWVVDGFPFGPENKVVNPAPRHAIWLQPTDATRVGQTFTMAVTVNYKDGRMETTTKKVIFERS